MTAYEDGNTMGDDTASDEDPDPFGFDEAGDDVPSGIQQGTDHVTPPDMRKKMDEQAAYICQLEDTNLRLQERIYLLERDLSEIQHGAAGSSRRAEAAAEVADQSGSEQRFGDEDEDDDDARSAADVDSSGNNTADAEHSSLMTTQCAREI